MRRLLIAALLSLALLVPALDAAAHSYTTSYLWCKKIGSGAYVLAETTNYWADRPFGGHYLYNTSTVTYWGAFCYPA